MMSDFLQPQRSQPGSSVHGDSPGESTGMGCHPLLQGKLSNQGIKPRSSASQADSLPSEPLGKPKDEWVTCHNLGERVQIRGLHKENRTELQRRGVRSTQVGEGLRKLKLPLLGGPCLMALAFS